MKKDILGAIIERRERINSAHIPTWDELPSLNLYMDQLIFILSEIFEPYFDDVPKLINKAIINNYVKLGYIPAPVKKKYSKEHIAYLVVVCSLKQVMPIADLGACKSANGKDTSFGVLRQLLRKQRKGGSCSTRRSGNRHRRSRIPENRANITFTRSFGSGIQHRFRRCGTDSYSRGRTETEKKLTAIEYISISIFKKVCFFIYLGKSIAFTEKI